MRTRHELPEPPPAVPFRDVQHHVNNAVNAIGGYAELALGVLADGSQERADVRQSLEAIAAAADGLAHWVGSVGEERAPQPVGGTS